MGKNEKSFSQLEGLRRLRNSFSVRENNILDHNKGFKPFSMNTGKGLPAWPTSRRRKEFKELGQWPSEGERYSWGKRFLCRFKNAWSMNRKGISSTCCSLKVGETLSGIEFEKKVRLREWEDCDLRVDWLAGLRSFLFEWMSMNVAHGKSKVLLVGWFRVELKNHCWVSVDDDSYQLQWNFQTNSETLTDHH